ncbi:MAG: hypothetical protein GY789_09820 [Hyphomicrobiales bacterium]|nr:hypothetical protein [Hyphomicrobiales bacterium]
MVSIRRQQAARQSDFHIDELAHAGLEPEISRRWARNLDNQFQVLMLFCVLVAMLLAVGVAGVMQITLAWFFVAGRFLHTAVQTQTDNVALRGKVFMINYFALSMIWLLFLARSFGWIH